MAGTKDIKDFTKFPSLSDNDYLLGTKTDLGGTDAGITVADLKKLVAQDVKPTIKNGYWWVNGINTGELATGRTPLFRYTENGMEMKYDNEDDAAYRVIIPIEDLLFTFDDLTPEQVELLKLKFSDLTDADKEELRGKAFTYDDFSAEQLTDLRLTWDKLTPGQKKELQGDRGYSAFEVWEQQEGNAGKTMEDYLIWLRQPAVSAALGIRQDMDKISEDTESVIRETIEVKEEADKAAVRANKAAEAAEGIVAGIVPTKTSDLENDNGFVTNAVNDLTYYYLKSETYTREEVVNLISQIKGVSILPVEVLPDTGETNIIYFLPKEGTEDDIYDEYIWLGGKWERIGSTSVDLSKYYTKDEVNARYVLKETGKRLMTNTEGTKLEGIEAGANKYILPTGEGYNFIPVGGEAGKALVWESAGNAKWGNVSGFDPMILGDFRFAKWPTSTETIEQVMRGYTADDIEQAFVSCRPIIAEFGTSGKFSHSFAKSFSKRIDGSTIYYQIGFDVYIDSGYGNNSYEIYLFITVSVAPVNWISTLSSYGFQKGGTAPIAGGSSDNNWWFNGGYTVISLQPKIATHEITVIFEGVQAYYIPMEGTVSTLLIVSTGSVDFTPSFKIDTSNMPTGRIVLADEIPTIKNGEAIEVSLLYINRSIFILRCSPAFKYTR